LAEPIEPAFTKNGTPFYTIPNHDERLAEPIQPAFTKNGTPFYTIPNHDEPLAEPILHHSEP
jgi:hypothetical protein